MTSVRTDTADKYDNAAAGWSDKMRLLGYFDAYLGFLSSRTHRAERGAKILDIGCGTGALAEAWVALHGSEHAMTLLDPSAKMLEFAQQALQRRGMSATGVQSRLGQGEPSGQFDVLLAAHVLEHAADPAQMLRDMRAQVGEGGELWLIVSKPHWCNAIIWLQWRHRAFRPAEVAELLSETGWTLRDEYAFPTGPPSRTSRGYRANAC